VALYATGSLIAFGEVIGCAPDALEVRTDRVSGDADTLLVRDAWRRSDGLIVTAPGATPSPSTSVVAPRVARGALTLRAGDFVTTLVNGVFGDPLVVVRARESRRVVLLDLGEATSLSRRVMHRVTDVFVTHAHFDHVAGLAWLLRARMGTVVPPCRIYGPPGMHTHVSGMIATVRWDRIGDAGPEFVVGDVHPDRIDWMHLKAGGAPRLAGSEPVRDGVLLTEPHLRVSAVELDHGIPVLAFCVESTPSFRIHKSGLEATGIAPGPWLRELKRHLLHGEVHAAVMLPNGRVATVAELANDLVKEAPATRIVYATDFADTAHNRRTLERLAANADALICEATFLEEDARQACRTHHLTARACGEIAAAARVRRLVPFHFSKRYEGRAEAVYAEIRAACRNVPIHTFAPDR
jgi:ribonuclease BN (tRNA processing enzyme)